MNRFAAVAACVVSISLAAGCTTEPEEEDVFKATSLAIEADGGLKVGRTAQLRVFGVQNDGKRQEISSGITFHSSDEEIATVDEEGMVTVLAGGPVSFTVSAVELEGVLEAQTSCDYPRHTSQLGYGRTVPPLSWPARWPDGTDFDFSLEDVHCNKEWKDKKTVTFVLSAGWCAPCTAYAQRLRNEVAMLNANGMQIVIVEVQDTNGEPADLEFAYSHLKRITSNRIPAIAIGDKDTAPIESFFENSGYIEYFPTTFVVRTSDMKIIADQKRGDGLLPLLSIARNPDGDWSRSGAPVFVNHCGPRDEEASEPNDTPAQAASLQPGTHRGGICTAAPDFYRVDVQGSWSLELEFDPALGDLDVFVWDAEKNEPAIVDGELIGSSNGTGIETFQHKGPALVGVMPFRSASAPYTIKLTEQ